MKTILQIGLLFLLLISFTSITKQKNNYPTVATETNEITSTKTNNSEIHYKNIDANGVKIAYREAGNPKNPTIVLLHGFPSSSRQYRKVLTQFLNLYK